MADEKAESGEAEEKPKKSGKKGLLIGLIGALIAGGGGFFATYTGALASLSGGESHATVEIDHSFSYVALDPLVVSLGSQANARHLKFTATLEVPVEHLEEVEMLKPRVIDALNTFLRAVDESELAKPSSMLKLRAQMLRRVQVVTGEGRIRDLLVLEFILN